MLKIYLLFNIIQVFYNVKLCSYYQIKISAGCGWFFVIFDYDITFLCFSGEKQQINSENAIMVIRMEAHAPVKRSYEALHESLNCTREGSSGLLWKCL